MRKALIIITAVALLGILAVYVKPAGNNNAASSESGGTSPAAETTTSSDSASSVTASTDRLSSSTSSASSGTGSGTTSAASGSRKDGTYQGSDIGNRFGDVQVSVTISGGKITAVTFDQLDANDQHSEQINTYAKSTLVSQTLSAQSANIAGVSGATYTSDSYIQSLQSALDKAEA